MLKKEQIDALAKNLKNIDPAQLCKIEVYGQPGVQQLYAHIPITPEGKIDETRKVEWRSDIKVVFNNQTFKVEFAFEANSIEEALRNWKEAAAAAGGEMLSNLADQAAAHGLLQSAPTENPS